MKRQNKNDSDKEKLKRNGCDENGTVIINDKVSLQRKIKYKKKKIEKKERVQKSFVLCVFVIHARAEKERKTNSQLRQNYAKRIRRTKSDFYVQMPIASHSIYNFSAFFSSDHDVFCSRRFIHFQLCVLVGLLFNHSIVLWCTLLR